MHLATRRFLITAFLLFSPIQVSAAPAITVCFTPGNDCTGLIVSTIDSAKRDVRVQAYSFTSAPIAKSLVAAHRRGVDVRVILDKSQATAKNTLGQPTCSMLACRC